MGKRLSADGIAGTLSLAGRVERPIRQPLPMRVGGFGGVPGLVRYLRDHKITHVVDATHPFAVQMSANAVAACKETGVGLLALSRAPWAPQAGDAWEHVADIAGAVDALDRPAQNVMLAVGRMHLAAFAPNPQHHYLLRLVDPPEQDLPFPSCSVVVDRGPFSVDGDLALMRAHSIDLVVSKNSGGPGAVAKIEAARRLGLPVIMIDRPVPPKRQEVHEVDGVLDWLSHASTARGV